jgi:hypothetical protein
MRASGLCITAQHLSGFLSVALPFAMWRATSTWRLTDLALAGLIGLGVLASWNFSAIVCIAIVGVLFPLMRWPRLVIQFLVLYLLFSVAAYFTGLSEYLWDELVADSGAGRGLSQRQTLNLIGLDKLDRSLLVGTGPQGFAEFTGNFWHRPVHNVFLQVATEIGLLGLLALLTAIFYLIGKQVIAMVYGTVGQSVLARLAFLGLVANIILSMSEPVADHSNYWLFLGLFQAIALTRTTPIGTLYVTEHSR